eukprot:3196969-Rhodomonas_salina.1
MQGFGSATTMTRRDGTSGCCWAALMLGTVSESGPLGPRQVTRGCSVASGRTSLGNIRPGEGPCAIASVE